MGCNEGLNKIKEVSEIMRSEIRKIRMELEAEVQKSLSLSDDDFSVDGNVCWGTALYPVVYRDGEIGIIGDGELQGLAVPDGDGFIGTAGDDGGLFGEDEAWTRERLLTWVRELVLSESNIQEAVSNLCGLGLGKACAAIIAATY